MARKRLVLIVAVGLLISASFLAGLVAGSWRKFGWMLKVQETEVTGSLNHVVGAATLVRAGNVERAIRVMEGRISSAVITLPQGREWEELPSMLRQSLVMAKKYFEAYPPQSQSEKVLERLRKKLHWIPEEPLDPQTCSPAVRLLLEDNQEAEANDQPGVP